MKRKTYSQILDRAARDNMASNSDLTPRIMAQIQKGKNTTMQLRTSKAVMQMKVFVTAFLILLVFAALLASVPAVRAAVQRWIGYVPNVGLVSEGQIRMLEEPVSVTRDGIMLTVEQVWAAPDRTLVQASIEGWPWRTLVSSAPANGCLDVAFLRLPDRKLENSEPQSALGWESGYQLKSVYPPIPSTVDEVTFVMPCLVLALPGEAPENWELSLPLIPAPPDMTLPVIEIPSPTPLPLPTTVSATQGISLALERAVPMDDRYLLYVTIHYENSGIEWIDIPDPTMLRVIDAAGQEVPCELDLDATMEVETTAAPGQTAFAIKTAPVAANGLLTLVLNSVTASMASGARFTFDPGPAPAPGQVWELNRDIDVGSGHSLRISRVTYDLTDGVQAYLSFEMESETGVTYASLFDEAHPLTGAGGGGGGASLPGPFTSELYYLEPLPAGPLTITIPGISVYLPGHWEAYWTPTEP